MGDEGNQIDFAAVGREYAEEPTHTDYRLADPLAIGDYHDLHAAPDCGRADGQL